MVAGQLFCRECGARFLTPVAAKKKISLDKIKGNLPSLQDATRLADKTGESLNAGLSTLKTNVSKVFTRLKESVQAVLKKNRKLFLGLGIGFVVISAYAIVQSVMLMQSGPDKVVAQIVDAAKSKNYEALRNESLFPNPNGYTLIDKDLLGIYGGDELKVGTSDSTLFSDDAYVTIESDFGTIVSNIHLRATDSWNFIFYQREWAVVSDAPSIKFYSQSIGKTQGVSFGDGSAVSFSGSNDPDFKAIVGKTFISFPGIIRWDTDQFGFEDANFGSVSVGSASTTVIRAYDGELLFPSFLEGNAKTKADATASWCANSECDLLPYFYDSDYSWDSDPAWDYYYNRSYSGDAFSSWGCELVDSSATSALRGYANFDCDIHGTKVITHIVDYYFYSDEYSYFNGTGSKNMSLRVNFLFNPSTGKYSITSVTD
jgi:hypothetical protein